MMQIGSACVTYYSEGAFTSYLDGTSYAAQPHHSHHYHVIAHRLGYSDNVLAYAREHEVCHHIVSEWIGGHTSKVLWPLAHGREPDAYEAMQEEALAMTFQRWLRANERPIIGGVDWTALRDRAISLIDGAGQ